jgi:hypothetical protein
MKKGTPPRRTWSSKRVQRPLFKNQRVVSSDDQEGQTDPLIIPSHSSASLAK